MKQYAVFLDASALVAYFNIEDEFHKQASEIIDSEEFNLKFYPVTSHCLNCNMYYGKKLMLLLQSIRLWV